MVKAQTAVTLDKFGPISVFCPPDPHVTTAVYFVDFLLRRTGCEHTDEYWDRLTCFFIF